MPNSQIMAHRSLSTLHQYLDECYCYCLKTCSGGLGLTLKNHNESQASFIWQYFCVKTKVFWYKNGLQSAAFQKCCSIGCKHKHKTWHFSQSGDGHWVCTSNCGSYIGLITATYDPERCMTSFLISCHLHEEQFHCRFGKYQVKGS